MTIKQLVASVSAAAFLSGCASVMTGEKMNVNVAASNGQEVNISVEGQDYITPAVVQLTKDGSDKIINSSDKNCDRQTVAEKSIEPWFWANIITGGLLGSTTDSVTEKMWTYDEEIVINCK
jgi:hypothetical protein